MGFEGFKFEDRADRRLGKDDGRFDLSETGNGGSFDLGRLVGIGFGLPEFRFNVSYPCQGMGSGVWAWVWVKL